MSIIGYRAKVAQFVKATFPQLKRVETHPGKFTLDDLDRLCTVAPAAYVAILAAPPKGRVATGQVLFNVCIAVFIATRHSREEDADEIGWRFVEAIAAMAQYNVFNDEVMPATNVEIENLWSIKQDRQSSCIMGVAWDAEILVGADYIAKRNTLGPDNPILIAGADATGRAGGTIGGEALTSTQDNP